MAKSTSSIMAVSGGGSGASSSFDFTSALMPNYLVVGGTIVGLLVTGFLANLLTDGNTAVDTML